MDSEYVYSFLTKIRQIFFDLRRPMGPTYGGQFCDLHSFNSFYFFEMRAQCGHQIYFVPEIFLAQRIEPDRLRVNFR